MFVEKSFVYGLYGVKWDWHVEELGEFFAKKFLEVAARRELMLFIDALDEAGMADARNLVQFFDRLSCELKANSVSAKICISCRHYPVIASNTCLEIVMENQNHRDIETYVLGTIQLTTTKTDSPSPFKSAYSLCEEICDRAEGNFQWGRFHLILPIDTDSFRYPTFSLLPSLACSQS